MSDLLEMYSEKITKALGDAWEENKLLKSAYNEVFEKYIPNKVKDEANDFLVDLLESKNKMGRDLLKKKK